MFNAKLMSVHLLPLAALCPSLREMITAHAHAEAGSRLPSASGGSGAGPFFFGGNLDARWKAAWNPQTTRSDGVIDSK